MAKQLFSLNLSRMRLLQRLVPVPELFKPAVFGPRFSSEARAQSSSEGIKLNRVRIKLNIPFFDGCCLIILFEYLNVDLLHVLLQVNCCQIDLH